MKPIAGTPVRVLAQLGLASLLVHLIFAEPTDADCVDYPTYLHWVTTVAIPGSYGENVAVYGSHAYVAARSAGLQVFDLSDPELPVLVGGVDTPSDAKQVSIAGPYAYVADGSSGLQVIDISNPAAPVIVGSVATPSSADYVGVSGSYAYVMAPGLQVIDVSNPTAPVIVSSRPYYGPIVVSAPYAYVGGLTILEITNPLSIVQVGSVASPCQVNDMDVSGSYACIAGYCGLQVVDVSNPASPVIVGSVATGGTSYSVTVSGTHAYVGTIIDGVTSVGDAFETIDISNPISPVIVGKVMGAHGETAVSGNHAYVVGPRNQGLHVFYVGNPSSPEVLGSLVLPHVPFSQIAVAASGNYVYVSGLKVIDVSNPASPQIVGGVNTPSEAIAVSGSYVYVASTYLFRVIDISNPLSPTIVSTVSDPWGAVGITAMVVSGNVAYVLASQRGLYGVNISNPAAPVIGGMTPTPYAYDVAVSGSYAYVADYSAGVRVIQLNPYPSGVVRTVDTPGGAYGIDISGSHAYVADGSRLQVLDISNPTAAVIVGSVDTQGQSAVDVAVSGSYAYVHERDGVFVADITTPAFPRSAGSVTILSGTTASHQIAASASLVYTTDWHFLTGGGSEGRLVVLPSECSPSIPNPGPQNGAELTYFSLSVTAVSLGQGPVTMSLVGSAPAWAMFTDLGSGTALLRGTPQLGQAGTYPVSIEVSDGMTSSTSTFDIVIAPAQKAVNLEASGFLPGTVTIPRGGQVTWVRMAPGNHTTTNGTGPMDPAAGTLWDGQLRSNSPEFVHVFTNSGAFPYFCRNHPSESGTITVTSAQTGVGEDDLSRSRIQASPNPFRAAVDLHFDLERAEHVSVTVVDLQGRRVRDLLTTELPAGEHRVTWDGWSEQHRTVGTGIYFARFVTGDGHARVQKLFKVR